MAGKKKHTKGAKEGDPSRTRQKKKEERGIREPCLPRPGLPFGCIEQLRALGLRVKSITADGNCFFRALGDQLHVCRMSNDSRQPWLCTGIQRRHGVHACVQGDEELHGDIRQRIVSHMVGMSSYHMTRECWRRAIARGLTRESVFSCPILV